MEFKLDLSKKVAMVTGASGGIGRAIGFALAGAGAKVLVNDISKDELESVARSIREKNMNVRPIQQTSQ
jgi:NADP-dependent 3-hydroxy acid dehydrogenase YdfG